MATATLTSKGQMTLPKEIRDRLGLKPGDRLECLVQPDGSIRIIPATVRLSDLEGILGKPPRKLSAKELDHEIRESWGTRWQRFTRQSR